MFISRQVYDPTLPSIPGNKAGRTTGVYGHWPKFWNCRKYNFNYVPKPYDTEEFIDRMNEVSEGTKAYHSHCRIPWHNSHKGYLVLVTKKRRYVLWYHGNNFRPGEILERQERRVPSIY